MKNIFSIFRHDLKNIAKNIIVFIVVIGIAVLPALYAWFNIAANWDPYSSTGGIGFAVCTKDKGYSYKIMTINAGQQIVSNLEKNDKMGWTFVSEQEALDGVKDGTYYAAVIIPEDFSENLFSVTTGKFKQAELHYYINEKKNAIAPKITDKGIQTIEETVNSTYVSTVTQVIASALNITADTVGDSKDTISDQIIEKLENAKNDIDGFKTTIDVFTSTLNTVDSLVKANKDMLPTIQDALNKGSLRADEIKDAVSSTRNTSKKVSGSVEGIIKSAQSVSDNISTQLDDAFQNIETNSASSADKLRTVTLLNEKIISVNNYALSILQDVQDNFGVDCSKTIGRLTNANDRQQQLEDMINSAADTITSTGKLPKETQDKIKSLASSANNELQSAETAFDGIKNMIDTAVDKSMAVLDDVSEMLQNLGSDVPNFETSLDNASNTIQSIKQSFEDLKDYIDQAKNKIDNLVTKVNDFKNNKTIENFITPIIENPEALGEFISSPVKVETTELFPIENYGTGMTPFYTSLGFWVGGIILVAIARTDLTKHELRRLNKPNSTQMFFGRYLIFFVLGQIQAWIIALGDLFFLKIQCENPLMFIAGCLISSFVYTIIIYSLTITFSVIGKALAVVILVIQIAGSGGTFPIEVLPAPFQAISPYLPFKYGINALREAVAGPDFGAFTYDILMLLAFVPFALILGIVLRKPCIKIINFLNERIEQSDVII
ncbi:MAG: YhgE/Pip domain-containing protein [Clostridia bacterium]|nr:YhgE/Pip domain-containing protein [Clostridia bacterium]